MLVLLIEAEPTRRSWLEHALTDASFELEPAVNQAQAIQRAGDGSFEVIILGSLRRGEQQLKAMESLREADLTAPIFVLGEEDSTDEIVTYLNAGADDYLAHPFEPRELVARTRALMRRCETGEVAILGCGDLHLDVNKRSVVRDGEKIRLTAREFGLLEHLVRNQNHVLSRPQIGEAVWDENFDAFSNVIDVFVSRLRSKVDKPFDTPLIHTVTGKGYMLSEHGPG